MGKRKTNTSTEDEIPEKVACSDVERLQEDEDEDLPNPFTPVKMQPSDFKEGDLVFAKFEKYPFWPAVFYKYMKRRKRKSPYALVHFFESATEDNTNKKVYKISLSKLKSYTCEERDELIKVGESESDFNYGMEKCDDYLTKRALGKISDFFYAVDEEEDDEDEDEERENEEQKSENDLDEDKNNKSENVSQEIKSTQMSPIKAIMSYDSNRRSRRNASSCNKQLLEWVKQSSKPFLFAVTRGEQTSNRHSTFIKGTQKEKDRLKWSSGFGPLDEDQSDDLLRMLVTWYQKEFPESSFNPITYVSEVWLPEAIIRGIANTQQISLSEAELKYLK